MREQVDIKILGFYVNLFKCRIGMSGLRPPLAETFVSRFSSIYFLFEIKNANKRT
jgi:hypothetical protein